MFNFSALTFASRVRDWVSQFLRKPDLRVLTFDAARDLRTWTLIDTGRIQKAFTLEVRNDEPEAAERCIALINIRPAGAAMTDPWFVLHWAGLDYAFHTSGAQPVSIGAEGRRLDVLFTFHSQQQPGCWIATPAALTAPLLTSDYLPPGEYDATIEIRANNASTRQVHYRIVSPLKWTDLSAQPRAS